MRAPQIPLRLLGLALLLVLAAPTRLDAQRNEQIRQAQQAYDNFETGRALDLLRAALVPQEGPRDSIWAHGVHLLAQIYIEEGQENVARSWLRWARRLVNDMPLDRVIFLPEVLAASNDARSFVVAQPEPRPDLVETSWRWSTGSQDPEGQGRLEIQTATPDLVTVAIDARPTVRPGEFPLQTGTHEISASAEGSPSVRLWREVLPGVTTVVTFRLAPIAVAAQPPPPAARVDTAAAPPQAARVDTAQQRPVPAAPPPQQPVARRSGGKFPIVIVLGGLAAAGGAAALLLGGGGGGGGNGDVTCWDGSTAASTDLCPTAITISVPNRSIIRRQ